MIQARTALFTEERGSVRDTNATRVTATTVDVILGFAGFNTAILYMISFIALFGHEIRRKVQKDGLDLPTIEWFWLENHFT